MRARVMLFAMEQRRFSSILAATGIFVSVLSGCGNNPYPPELTSQPILFRSQADDPRKLDPATSYRADEGAILGVITPSYYHYNYLKTQPFQLEPLLGAQDATVKTYDYVDPKTKAPKSGQIWTFRIRRDLRFQDDPCFPGGKGRAITAQDFVYAFHRMVDPANGSPVLGFFEDKVVGFPEIVARNAVLQKAGKLVDYLRPLQGVEVDKTDPYTFRITLNQPYPQLRYLMAMPFTAPMAHEAIAFYGKDIARHPIGCGAYLLEEWTPKRRIVLAKNPNRVTEFYPSEGEPGDREEGLLKLAGQQLPLAEKIIITNIAEGTTGWNLFLQGYMDAWGVTQINYQQTMTQQGTLSPEMRDKGIRLNRATELSIYYFAFNMNDPVVGGYTPEKRKLRQAMSLAVNSRDFIQLFSQGNGLPAQSIIPPGIFGYDPNYVNPYRQYDPQLKRAKQLLAEAGYPKGISKKTGERLTIYYDNARTDAAGRQYNGLIERQIEALGINFQSRPQRDIVWQNKIDGNDWQFTSYGWLTDYPDPENLDFLLYGPNKRPGPNLTAYNNPTYNRIFEKMRAMEDGPERLKLIHQLRQIMEEDCPLIWLQHGQSLGLSYSWLSPGKQNPIANDTLKYRAVDAQERVRLQKQWNQPRVWPIFALIAVFVLGSLPAWRVVKTRHRRRVTRDQTTEK